MRIVPWVFIVFLAMLAVLGSRLRSYELPPQISCAYALAEEAAKPADVLFIGSSRIGRGLDPAYMEQRLLRENGVGLNIERISLSLPNIVQYRPVIDRYIEQRGAPKLAFVQLIYNFKPERQAYWDVPINPPRNVAFASVATLADIQFSATSNPSPGLLPQRFAAGYQSFGEVLLSKFEVSVYSALRYVPRRRAGKMPPCTGAFLHRTGTFAYRYGDLDDSIAFQADDPVRLADLDQRRVEVAGFLPPVPTEDWRRFETGQIKSLIARLEEAGTRVVLTYLPALEQRDLDAATRAQIAQVFPDNTFVSPAALFVGPLGDQLAVSYTDTHHADSFGALHYSRFFADEIIRQMPK